MTFRRLKKPIFMYHGPLTDDADLSRQVVSFLVSASTD